MSAIPDVTRINHARYRLLVRTVRVIVAVAVLTIIALVAAASAHASSDTGATPATVTLHEIAAVGQGTIRLGQIGDIEASGDFAGQLAEVEIGPSPLAGREREIRAGYVRMRIARAGFDRDTVALEGAPAVVVRHAAAVQPVAPTVHRPAQSNAVVSASPSHQQAVAPAAPPAPVVKRGSNVKITVYNGGLVVTTTGQLLDDAAVGDFVTARVKTTSRKVCGTLSSPRDLTVTL